MFVYPSSIRGRISRKSGSELLLCACVMATLLPLSATSSLSQQLRPTESQVKAAYLYNFGKFVTWTDNPSAGPNQFEIYVLGKDPFGAVLDATVAGESIDSKKIVIRRITRVDEANPYSVLFISSSEEGRLPTILAAAQHLNLLTVSDIKNFAEKGGMIGLVTQGDRIRFVVNRTAAEDSHLSLSSELLKVAMRVIGKQ